MGHLTEITGDDTFEEAISGSLPALIDFWAPWCGPCKALTPILEELSDSYKEKILFFKVNVDDNQDLAAKYGVRGIPTVILFKNGEVKANKVGLLNKSQLTAFIDANM